MEADLCHPEVPGSEEEVSVKQVVSHVCRALQSKRTEQHCGEAGKSISPFQLAGECGKRQRTDRENI